MKKTIALIISILAVALLAVPFAPASSAAAETDLAQCSVAVGYVGAVNYVDYFAPCSGVIDAMEIEVGDTLKEGTVLFSMLTGTVTATEDGTVRGVFSEAGKSADAASAKYGAVVILEPMRNQLLQATYSGAHDSDECKNLHVGDVLYFKTGDEEGSGTVIQMAKNGYAVLIEKGVFEDGKSMDLFLDEERSSEKKTGKGTVCFRDDVPLAASGIIDKVLVSVGDDVAEGAPLFTVLPADADFGASSQVIASRDGVVGATGAVAGQQVWKGQLIARIYDTSALEVLAEIDEMDIGRVQVGDKVPVTMDTDEGTVLSGTVTEISGFGTVKQNATYYTVHIALEETGLLLNQRASVYIP